MSRTEHYLCLAYFNHTIHIGILSSATRKALLFSFQITGQFYDCICWNVCPSSSSVWQWNRNLQLPLATVYKGIRSVLDLKLSKQTCTSEDEMVTLHTVPTGVMVAVWKDSWKVQLTDVFPSFDNMCFLYKNFFTQVQRVPVILCFRLSRRYVVAADQCSCSSQVLELCLAW